MPAIEKYYKIEEVFAWQWDGNTNITIEDIPEEIRNEITMLKVERSIKHLLPKNQTNCFSTIKAINTIYSPATS